MIYDLQKADIWKRISAFLFDLILFFIAAVGFIFLLSEIVDFDSYTEQYESRQAYYEEQYFPEGSELSLSIDEEAYNKLSESDRELFDSAFAEFSHDEEANYAFAMLFQLTIITLTFGILLAFILLEFVVPLLFKNGQTLGKKIFGLGVMRLDGVKISGPILFIRSILCKYTIETMIPLILLIMIIFGMVGVMGPVIILLILVSNVAMMMATKTNSAIHDMLANTVTVDMSSQIIFDSPEALLEYKQKIHAEMVERKEY